MVMINGLELGDQNANQMNKKDTVVSLQYASSEKIDHDTYFNKRERMTVILFVMYDKSDHR